ncbi:MAG: DASH family cryptochrome [Kaiparowitsia implicata GSE-PSE-MK54-09C]|jgi:deoxyribodipyrimidine photo-lyase|nr:DASH family cryptochrome [Kaiparowitsia implicata GSE-PSE-MK54-09C]
MASRILLWFRTDLRLHDHAPLCRAIAHQPSYLVPLYCIDPRQFSTTYFGFAKTGAFRAQFLLESLADLRQTLRHLGSDLVVRQGKPEDVVPQLVADLQIDAVYYHREATAEETRVETALNRALQPLGVDVKPDWGHTLYHPDDLPFDVTQTPDVFTQFRKQVERESGVNPPLPAPTRLPPLPAELLSAVGELPTLTALGLDAPTPDARAGMRWMGGETAGKARVQDYLWESDRLKVYKATRNGMLHPDDSSKFSAWLALGCLSPRYIHAQVQAYETQRIQNDSTYWLVFELLWRDYFRFICAQHGTRVFQPDGLQGISIPWQQDWARFDLWRAGQTGFPLVDANLRELAATGYMSNRGRQNVASFLTKNLGIDWRMGAEWFESLLIDYDVCSNYGNWNYTAGVGNDARGFRFFNILKQSKDYDPQGEYVKHWLPELAQVPTPKVHQPWLLNSAEQQRFGVVLGVDYPHPVVDLFKSAEASERAYNAAMGYQPQRSSSGHAKPRRKRTR